MWNTKIEYFEELREQRKLVKINFHLADKICKGYIRVINDDGVFVATEMGDEQGLRVQEATFIPYSAISFVECGL